MTQFLRWRALALAAALAFCVCAPAYAVDLLPATTITAAVNPAVSTTPLQFAEEGPRNVTIEAIFAWGSGGTTADAYVQTTMDGGATWIDVANFHFTTAVSSKVINLSSLTPVTTQVTPADGALAANTAQDGVIGSQLRVKYKSSGTYAGGTTLQVTAHTSRLRPTP